MTRASGRLLLFLAPFAACHEPSPDVLYLEGNYVAAKEAYNPQRCAALPPGSPDAEECHARAEEIDMALQSAARYLGDRARERTRYRNSIQYNDYGRAKHLLRLAIGLLPQEDALRTEYEAWLERIDAALTSFGQEYEEQQAKLQGLLQEEAEYEPEVWREIRRTFERLRILRIALQRADGRPTELALRYVQHLRKRGNYERAAIATELASAVEQRGSEFPTQDQLSDEDLLSFAFIAFRAEKQKQRRKEQLEVLLADMQAALDAEDLERAGRKAGAALLLDPKPEDLRRLRQVLRLVDAPSQANPDAHREVVQAEAPAPPPAHADTPDAPTPAPTERSTAEDEQEAARVEAERQEVGQTLGELVEDFEQGRELQAIIALEQLSEKLEGSEHQGRAERLRRLWEPDRRRLLRESLREADRLYVEMDEGSLRYYRQALSLSPKEEQRKYIEERIGTLERILAQ